MTRLLDLLNWISDDDPGIVVDFIAAAVVLVMLVIASAASTAVSYTQNYLPGETLVYVRESQGELRGQWATVVSYKWPCYRVRLAGHHASDSCLVNELHLITEAEFMRRADAGNRKPTIAGIPVVYRPERGLPK